MSKYQNIEYTKARKYEKKRIHHLKVVFEKIGSAIVREK